MTSFYNTLPWPLYLLITIGLGAFLVQYFSRKMTEYTIPLCIGVILMSCSSIFAGIVRILYLLDLTWHIKLIESLPLFGLIGLPLIFVGGILRTKVEPEKRRIILLGGTIAIISLMMIGTVVITSLF
ncbi:hypothetical protein [Cohnella lupini]|uniref:hypothetical protein n=1 Tax=Cohnella lupini TaxID=1294267 RepID=UPI0011C03C70|nr:hypothetical protein [Cohnella lupini]